MEVGEECVIVKRYMVQFFCDDGTVMYIYCGSGYTNPYM